MSIVTLTDGRTLADVIDAVTPKAPSELVAPKAKAKAKAKATVTPWASVRLASASVTPSLKPAAVFDALADFAAAVGLPFADAKDNREHVLRLAGTVGKARFTSTGTRASVAVNLAEAAKLIADKDTAKAVGKQIKAAATLLALAADTAAEITL